jgi:adenine-specific DNA-methyltransferase
LPDIPDRRLLGPEEQRSPRRAKVAINGTINRNYLLAGDAADALASLSRDFEGSVRLALLDPPYNTSSKFHHYRDSQKSDVWLAERRLHLASIHQLLSRSGSVWMHLDDSELHYCKIMMDGLFGRENYVGTVVWQKTMSRENRTAISTTHEYILVYAKDKKVWARHRNALPPTSDQLNRYKNPDNDPRGPWTSGDMTAKAGPGRRAAQFYELVAPGGRTLQPAPGMAWRYTKERLLELIADGRVNFGASQNNMPRLKRFLSETQGGLVPTTWWAAEEVGTTDSAKKQLRKLFPALVPFETPKPEELTSRIIHIASDPGDLVLDCYAGSGTTPAVAHKMSRRWIAVERQQRTIEEFLRPRIEAVIGGEQGGVSSTFSWAGGGAYEFRPYEDKADTSVM